MISLILKPSSIPNAGIGCYPIDSINKNTQLVTGPNLNRRLEKHEIPLCYLKYCVLQKCGLFLAPEDFNQMNALWYVNHSKDPNLEFRDGKLHTRRRVEPGRELTLYYSDLLTHPINWWVTDDMI